MDELTKQLINNTLNAFDALLAGRRMGQSMVTETVLINQIQNEIDAIEECKAILKQEVLKLYPDTIFEH